MSGTRLAIGLGGLRALIGAMTIVAPGKSVEMWGGRGWATPAGRVMTRATGGRDIALGLGAVLAARRGAPVRGWIEAGMAADVTDAVWMLLDYRKLVDPGRRVLVLGAVGFAALGRAAVMLLERDDSEGRLAAPGR